MANNYEYNYNAFNNEDYTQEELEQMARNVEQSNREHRERVRQGRLNNLSRRRLGRLLGQQPGVRSLAARARGTVNARRRVAAAAQARANAINAKWRAARAEYKRDVNNAANAQFGSNENINANVAQHMAFLADLPEEEQIAGVQQITNQANIRRASKRSFKNQAVEQIRRGLRNSLRAENASVYANTRRNLLGQPLRNKQTILKMAALEDLLVEEKMKLAVAPDNQSAKEIASRIVDLEALKNELREVLDRHGVPTAEQEARYVALTAGVDFGAINSSLYHRLAENLRKNLAASKISALYRGKKGRNVARSKRAIRNAAARWAAEAAAEAPPPMVPVNLPAEPQGQALGGIARPLSKAEIQAARLARLSGAAGKGGKRRQTQRRRRA